MKRRVTFENGRLVEYENHNTDEEYEAWLSTGGNASSDCFEGD